MDKEYDFISIFGFATDTYDILGKIVRVEKLQELLENDVRKVATIYEGERKQKYPLYSSKMISKKKILPKKEKKSSREQLSDRDWRESEEIFQQKNTPVVREDLASDFFTEKLLVAREFEDAVIEVLVSKTKVAIEKYWPKTLIIGGGVIANKALRENFLKLKENYPELEILIPEKSLTTDNGTMIALAGFIEYLRNKKPTEKLKAQGNLDID